MVIAPPEDPRAFQESFTNGTTYSYNVRYGYFADEDRTTLERFDQLMVWEPEKTE
jgi:hypothetical protein